MFNLSGADVVNVDGVDYCKYCGEKAIISGSYSNHGREYDEELYCRCEGAERSGELKKELWSLYNKHKRSEEAVMKHQNTVHKNIIKRQLESELKKLRTKYKANIVYVLEGED